jgi:hypothetical protein
MHTIVMISSEFAIAERVPSGHLSLTELYVATIIVAVQVQRFRMTLTTCEGNTM